MVEESERKLLVTIGNSIRILRTKKKMSQGQLAFEVKSEKTVKTDSRHIRRIEAGQVNISFILLFRISQVLETTISELMKETKEE